jgi:cellulose synthase/poly-beta-1,6-N-acetylglucosamine synthase-like glycosyltransferase
MTEDSTSTTGREKVSIVIISKDETFLADTIDHISENVHQSFPTEIIVIDASDGRLDWIRQAHPAARWIDFQPPPGVRISIPHQRNRGVAEAGGSVVVFTDAGCRPGPDWLDRLIEPIVAGEERIAVGPVNRVGSPERPHVGTEKYVQECPTINLAFRPDVFDELGGFDERFEYGSDLDFSWRVVDAGIPIRLVGEAVITAEWGGWQRQLKRSYVYGIARTRLHDKHRAARPSLIRSDVYFVSHGVGLVSLPLALLWPPYAAIVLLSLWKSRGSRNPFFAALNEVALSLGFISELTGYEGHRRRRKLARRTP